MQWLRDESVLEVLFYPQLAPQEFFSEARDHGSVDYLNVFAFTGNNSHWAPYSCRAALALLGFCCIPHKAS